MRMWLQENGPDSAREIVVRPGEFIIIPKGMEHLPKADPVDNSGECEVLLLEPKTTLTPANVVNERTRKGTGPDLDEQRQSLPLALYRCT